MASYWLVQIEEHGLTPDERRRFERWLGEDPRHARCYDDLGRTWQDIGTLDHLAGIVPAELATRPAGRTHEDAPDGSASFGGNAPADHTLPLWRRRKAVLALAAGLATLLLVPTILLRGGESYETAVGQSRRISLADGSRIALAPGSALRVRMTGTDREVTLERGEAFFQIAHDPDRPFAVHASGTLIQDVGTSFDVNLTRETVRVAVREGQVDVRRAGQALRSLHGGEAIQLALAPRAGATAAVVPTSPDNPGAWRNGRLMFDNVRLADLATDANRYYPGGIRLASPDIGDLRITASFRTDEIPAFFAALGETLPVRTETDESGAISVRSEPDDASLR